MNHWIVFWVLSQTRKISSDYHQSNIDYENKNKIEELDEKLKYLEKESKKLKDISRIINDDEREIVRCYHSYNENLSGYHELQRYGCRCKK